MYFGQALVDTPRMILPSCRKLSHLSAAKKSASSPVFFWRYYKDMQVSHFGYFGHAWPRTPQNDKIKL